MSIATCLKILLEVTLLLPAYRVYPIDAWRVHLADKKRVLRRSVAKTRDLPMLREFSVEDLITRKFIAQELKAYFPKKPNKFRRAFAWAVFETLHEAAAGTYFHEVMDTKQKSGREQAPLGRAQP